MVDDYENAKAATRIFKADDALTMTRYAVEVWDPKTMKYVEKCEYFTLEVAVRACDVYAEHTRRIVRYTKEIFPQEKRKK